MDNTIKELEKISKELFDKQDFFRAGRINLAIDVLNELKNEKKDDSSQTVAPRS
jgi:hypothetical protein